MFRSEVQGVFCYTRRRTIDDLPKIVDGELIPFSALRWLVERPTSVRLDAHMQVDSGPQKMDISEVLTNRHCLLVLLRSELTLAMAGQWPFETFRLDDTVFEDVGLGDWTGFYDWLRRADGELVGVRYWPTVPNESLFDAARSLAYANATAAGSLEILFSPSDVVDPQRSGDQEFLYDAVFRSPKGEWAIAFDTAALKPSDLERLRQLNAAWASVTV